MSTVMMLALVLVVLVVLLLVFGRRQSTGAARGALPPPGASPPPGTSWSPRAVPASVEEVLERAVARGLLTREIADEIVASEMELAPPPARVSATVEAIGYVGAILTMVGAVVLVAQYWADLATWSRLVLLGAVTFVLWLVGALLRDEESPVIWRLRGFVWFLAAGALAGFTGVLVVDALEWTGESVAISIGAAVAAFGVALWQLKDRPAQQLTSLVGLLIGLGGLMALLDGGAAIGLTVAAVGGAWFVVGSTGRLPPKLAAVTLGLLALLIGPAITTASMGAWEKIAPVIGLVVAGTLLGVGARIREFMVTGAGVVGVFVYLPWMAGALFADTVGVPIILLVSGVLLLTVTLVLLRSRHGPGRSTGGGPTIGAGPARPALH